MAEIVAGAEGILVIYPCQRNTLGRKRQQAVEGVRANAVEQVRVRQQFWSVDGRIQAGRWQNPEIKTFGARQDRAIHCHTTEFVPLRVQFLLFVEKTLGKTHRGVYLHNLYGGSKGILYIHNQYN